MTKEAKATEKTSLPKFGYVVIFHDHFADDPITILGHYLTEDAAEKRINSLVKSGDYMRKCLYYTTIKHNAAFDNTELDEAA